ncbi:MAG: GNAT family N-acetyltransferase [Flavobacterium sp. JAD_PAG50586_2]|nr:MAG: GNAT family N-acetyltransferase [Flavobacterium sp. JAD_PAG50586_2]
MISICNNTDDNFTAIRVIAYEVWPIAYGTILSQAQLDYMMEMMYSIDSLRKQAASNKTFILAMDDEIPVGFASYEFNYNGTSKTKIHKIYILSNQQGKGTGRVLIDYIIKEALRNNEQGLLLNVNKNNVAQQFYKKLGFNISSEEIIDIGNGYVMDDYVMEIAI